MALQNWIAFSGTASANPKLSKKARFQAAKQTKLSEVVDPSDDLYLGKNSGDSVAYRLYGRITSLATTALGEFQPVPFTSPTVYHGSAIVYRYAQAIAWTGEIADIDHVDVKDAAIAALTDSMARTENYLIDAALAAGQSFTYAPTGATAGTFTSDGTCITSAAAAFGLWHVMNIARYMLKMNVPYADGENYIAVISPTAKFNLLADTATANISFTDVKKYASGGAEGILRNEIGSAGGIRFICDNDVLDDGIGTSSLYGSGYVCGHEAIKEIMVYPAHFRFQENLGQDFGNQAGIAWQMLKGWSVPWNYTTHGEGRILALTSA